MFESENIQIYPSKVRITPNDRVAKKLFNLTDSDLQDWIEKHQKYDFIEMQNHKKFGKILSPIELSVEGENFTISEALDQFDCAVLSVCISEWKAGNRYTTPSIIYRGLTGKVGDSDANPSKDQLAAIFNSIDKLMRLQLTYDMTDLCEKLKYNNGKPEKLVSVLLPCHYLKSSTVNGKDTTIISLDAESPLWRIAHIKNHQIITYDTNLLNVPNQQNTKMNITVKNYVMIRIQEIQLHKLQPVITFKDVFEKCRIEDKDNKIKQRAREIIIEFMNHLKSKSEIKDFEVTKKRNSFYSIKFSYTPKKAKQYRFPKTNENDNQ